MIIPKSITTLSLFATTIHLQAPVAMTAAAVMAPLVTVRVERNPTARPAFEMGLRNVLRVDALPVLLQLRNDLVVVVSWYIALRQP